MTGTQILLTLWAFMTTIAYGFYLPGSESSYAKYPKLNACRNASISFDFKVKVDSGDEPQENALLMYMDDGASTNQYFSVELEDGLVTLKIKLRDQQRYTIIQGPNPKNTGEWVHVEIERRRMLTVLEVDGERLTNLSFASDFDFGNPEDNSEVYFGGIPEDYPLTSLSLLSAGQIPHFKGDFRNVLYGNCTCLQERAAMVMNVGVPSDSLERCDTNDPCSQQLGEGCVCLTQDDKSPKCECSQSTTCSTETHYYLNFESNVQDRYGTRRLKLYNEYGLDAECPAPGQPRLYKSFKGLTLQLRPSRNQYARVAGPSHRKECLGDLSLCPNGYTFSIWMKFVKPVYEEGVYMSNGGHSSQSHGIAVLYGKGILTVVFRMRNGRVWRTRYNNMLEGSWYHITATWDQNRGLFLYINGVLRGSAIRSSFEGSVSGQVTDNYFTIGRPNENRVDQAELNKLGELAVDEFSFNDNFKDADWVRNHGPMNHMILPMNKIDNNNFEWVNGISTARLIGNPTVVPGRMGNALRMNGAYVLLNDGEGTGTCLTNLNNCFNRGFMMSMWVMFNQPLGDRTYYLVDTSGDYGISLFYQNRMLQARASIEGKRWSVSWSAPQHNMWYFIQLSWGGPIPLELYVNLQKVASTSTYVTTPIGDNLVAKNVMLIGRKVDGGYTAPVVLDDVHIWFGSLDSLDKGDFILRGVPKSVIWSMDSLESDTNQPRWSRISLNGAPNLAAGKIRGAVQYNGVNQYGTAKPYNTKCNGNIDYCLRGVTLSAWIKPGNLRNNEHYMSTSPNGIDLYIRNGRLTAVARTMTREWSITTNSFAPDQWQYIEVSWNPVSGLKMYRNFKMVAETSSFTNRDADTVIDPNSSKVDSYFGRGRNPSRTFANMTIDEVELWQADRDILLAHDYILRGKPTDFLFDMDNIDDRRGGRKLSHQQFDIPIFGASVVNDAKINRALRLSGRSQYADLGVQTDKCLGNITMCSHGFTLALWIKFEDLEDNSYYFSSGDNGVVLSYKNEILRAEFKNSKERWPLTARDIKTDTWYQLDLSWHPERGAAMFIDNKLVDEEIRSIGSSPSASGSTPHFYIGKANVGDAPSSVRTKGADAILDEMEVWYADRYYLVAHDYLQRGVIPQETISFEKKQGNTILHPRLDVTAVNGATTATGKVGKTLVLDGDRQYVDIGDHSDKCFENLDLCPFGLTVSLMINADEYRDGQTFLSSDNVNVFQRNGRTYAEFKTPEKVWTVSTSLIRPDQWYEVDLSWHPDKGLVMYVDGQRGLEDTSPTKNTNPSSINHNIYVGRDNRGSLQSYAKAKIDEIQFWEAPREVLVANGYKLGANVYTEVMDMDSLNGNKLENTKRDVEVVGNPRIVPGVIDNALYLNGRGQYVDLGSNITCFDGNLKRCLEGYTLRMRINPEELTGDTYMVSSNPLEVFHKNNRLYVTFNSPDRTWMTSSQKLDEDKWNLIDVTWDNENGVRIFKDNEEISDQMTSVERDDPDGTQRHFYIGRANTNMISENYLDGKVDDVQIWHAKRESLISRGILSEPAYTWIYPADSRKGFVRFDFDAIPDKYKGNNNREEMHIKFQTLDNDGLLWLNGDESQKAFLTLKDGNLVLVYDYGNNVNDTIILRPTDGSTFNDNNIHDIVIKRDGRNIVLSADNEKYKTTKTIRRVYRFNNPAYTYVGGTSNTRQLTNNLVRKNFLGSLRNFKITGDVMENNFDMMQYVHQDPIPNELAVRERIIFIPALRGTLTPISSPVTFKAPEAYLSVPGWNTDQPQTNISIAFTTVEPNGLLLYQPGKPGKDDFLAVEMYDGKVYTVASNGGVPVREEISDKRVDDGRIHEVDIESDNTGLKVTLDKRDNRDTINGITRRAVNNQARLPFGSSRELDLGSRLYVGGYPGQVDWHLWSRKGFIGCVERVDKDGESVDLEGAFQNQKPANTELRCLDMPDRCRSRPCLRGVCEEFWSEYKCDCSQTDYTDRHCDRLAPVGNFDGKEHVHINNRRPVPTHVNDISMRFKTPRETGTLLSTTNPRNAVYYKIDLDNGRLKFTTNLGGATKRLFAGQNLNDNEWHTLKVRRRANYAEFWVDDESSISTELSGSDYNMLMKDIYIGALMRPGSTQVEMPFMGHMKNIIIDGEKYFDLVGRWPTIPGITITGKPPSRRETPQPSNPYTFKTPEAYVSLTQLTRGTKLAFMFKTQEPDGLIVYNGPAPDREDFLALQLKDGILMYTFNTGDRVSMTAGPGSTPLNDNKWHYVKVEQPNELKTVLTVDDLQQEIPNTSSDPDFHFGGKLHLGGVPENMYDQLPDVLEASKGFKGCLASLDLDGRNPDLFTDTLTRHPKVAQGCGNFCDEDTCINGGKCLPDDTCDCSMTSYTGETCKEQENGFRFGENNQPGIVKYVYPSGQLPSTTKDQIAFGFMTYDCDGILFRVENREQTEYIEARLENGEIKVDWKVDRESTPLVERRKNFCDGNYHILRFERNGNTGTLSVDDLLPNEKQATYPGTTFNRLALITVGGGLNGAGGIREPLNSIVAGLYFNGVKVLKLAENHNSRTTWMRDTRPIPPPFRLEPPRVQPSVTPKTTAFCSVSGGRVCSNYGVCLTSFCNCNFTAYGGLTCEDEPYGIYFGKEGNPGIGMLEIDGGISSVDDKLAIGFMTYHKNGVLYRAEAPQGHYIEVSMKDGFVVTKYDLGYGEQEVSSLETFNDGEYHAYRFNRHNGNVNIQLDDFAAQPRRRAGYVSLPPMTSIKVGASGYKRGTYDNVYNGILGGVNYNDMYILDHRNIVTQGDAKEAGHPFTLVGLPESFCSVDGSVGRKCENGGICVNGDYCDCTKVSFVGPLCNEYGVGYRYNTTSKNVMIKYIYDQPKSQSIDEMAFGFMTYDNDGTLIRIDNQGKTQFMEFQMINGQLWLIYNLGDGLRRRKMSSKLYNDGLYHQVRLVRDRSNMKVFIGGQEVLAETIHNMAADKKFRDQYIIRMGGLESGNGQVTQSFDGILAGVYYNGLRFMQLAQAGANGITKVGGGRDLYVIKPFVLTRPLIPTKPGTGGGAIMGGGGGAWTGGAGAGESLALGNGAGGAGIGGVGAAVAPAAAGVGGGTAAGAAAAAILALLMLVSALIWAIYKCKPGLIPCCGSGAAAGAPAAGAASYPLLKGGVFGASAAAAGGGGAGLAGAGAGFGAGGAGAGFGAGGAGFGAGGAGYGAGMAGAGMAGAGGAGFTTMSSGGSVTNGYAGGGGGGGGGYSQFSANTMNRQTVYDAADGSMVDGGGMMMGEGGNIYDSNTMMQTNTMASGYGSGGGSTMGNTMRGQGYGGNTMTSGFRSISESNSYGGGGGGVGGGSYVDGYNNTMGGMGSNTMHNFSTSSSTQNFQSETTRFGTMGGAGTLGGMGTLGGSTQFVGMFGAGGSVSTPFITLPEEVKVDCCLLTSDGRHVVTGSCTGSPQVWNMSNGELVTVMAGDDMNSTDLHLAVNDTLLVGQVSTEQSSLDMSDVQASNRVPLRKLQIWDFESGQPLEMADGQMCSAIAMMSDGRKVVLGRTDKFGNATNLTIYDLMGNETLRDIRYEGGIGIADSVCCLHLSPDDRYVIAGFNNSYDGNANFVVFDLSVSEHTILDPKIIALDAEPQCTCVLDTQEAVTGTRKGELTIWSLRTGKALRQLISAGGGTMTVNRMGVASPAAHSGEVKDLVLSKDGRTLVSASADGTLKVWNMETEKLQHTLSGHKDEVWCCDISQDGEMIVSGSRDSCIRLWRTCNGAPICSFPANMDIFSVKMSANAGTVVALGDKFASRKLIMLQIVHSRSRRH